VEAACRDEALWGQALETHFAQLEAAGRRLSGAHRRNIRSNLRTVFKVAAAHGLLTVSLPPRLLTKPQREDFDRQYHVTSPYASTYRPTGTPRRFYLRQPRWPEDIQEGWRAYRARCEDRIRETSFESYAVCLSAYFGYLAHIVGRTPTWGDCFDVPQLRAFVRWYGERLRRSATAHGRRVVIIVAAMAKVLEHDNARALADLRNSLKAPEPVHNKRAHHWVSLADLEAVADALLAEGRLPYSVGWWVKHPGLRRAARFQRGLILKLLVRIPLRQRNVRELLWREHLYQDERGHWWLHFRGSDLKIGIREGRANKYEVDLTDYCPEFLPLLDEFLTTYRSRFPGAATSPFLFLTQAGRPFTAHDLYVELSHAVAMRTGRRFYPHMIRTIFATEFLEEEHDYAAAATLLGDTLAVVMKTYYNIEDKDQYAKAKTFLGKKLHTG
jgi:hypothetical protein